MFSQKPFICYLSSTSFVLYDANNVQHSFAFSPSATCYSEIIDANKFNTELRTFIQGLNLHKGKGIVLLASELVYVFRFNQLGQNEKRLRENIGLYIPLRRNDIAIIANSTSSQAEKYIANQNFYDCILNILSEYEIHITSVVPFTVVTMKLGVKELNATGVKTIVHKKNLLEKDNFLRDGEQMVTLSDKGTGELFSKNEVVTHIQTRYIIFGLCAALLLTIVLFLVIWFIKSPLK